MGGITSLVLFFLLSYCSSQANSSNLVAEFTFYEHAIRKASGIKIQTEFTIAGQPLTPGYATTYNNKFTKTAEYISPEVGRAIGLLAWPSSVLSYVSAVYVFPEGSITVNGYVNALALSFNLIVSAGTGNYSGTFGNIDGVVVSISDGGSNFVVRETVKLFKP